MWLLFVLILVIILFIKEFGNLIYYGSKLPGPKAYPIIGNGLLFINEKPSGNFFNAKWICYF